MVKLIRNGLWLGFMVGMMVLFFPRFPKKMETGSVKILIPKIEVSEPLIVNVDPNRKEAYQPALREGIALAAGSALPGTSGLGYYFGHSSSLEDGLLRPVKLARLNELMPGDEIKIIDGEKQYKYQITEKRITGANDVAFLRQPVSGEKIVVQTCWPIGTRAKRLLVFAQRAS